MCGNRLFEKVKKHKKNKKKWEKSGFCGSNISHQLKPFSILLNSGHLRKFKWEDCIFFLIILRPFIYLYIHTYTTDGSSFLDFLNIGFLVLKIACLVLQIGLLDVIMLFLHYFTMFWKFKKYFGGLQTMLSLVSTLKYWKYRKTTIFTMIFYL